MSEPSQTFELRKHIEFTLLRPDCKVEDIQVLCAKALESGYAGVCVPPYHVKAAAKILQERGGVRLTTVIGFPMGYQFISAKSEEIKRACNDGADELDVTLNVSAVKSGLWKEVMRDIDDTARAIRLRGKTGKLIIEYGLLSEPEVDRVCAMAAESGFDYIKTGTGFHHAPATPQMIAHLRRILPSAAKIKAAGGIRTPEEAMSMLRAGADRIGTSSAM
ncbi:MAG: deoxyribose-phosphate aldolase [Saprospiraceae bacterium]